MAEQGPLTGQRLDKFLLGELLGQGGFGAVYKAQHLLLNRPQAIKVLLEQHFGSPKFRERFIREAQTLAALDHANILPVHDFGVEGSRAYLVMPFISGGTLQSVLKARPGPLSLDETARYLAQICAALDYAHKRGVVHLNLKPLNLLMHEDGRLLLSDFGLAHLMEQGAVEGGTSLQFGSPLYMAPEHFDGNPERRSDLYALGIILYQLLAGRVPFTGTSPMALMRQHLTEPPPPLHAARPDLPPALDAVLGKALTKQPAYRYQTAGELLYDFQAALAGRLSQPLGGASSLPYQQTRLSQPLLPETVRAVNPPVFSADGGWAGSGSQAPWQPSQPVIPQTPWQYAPTAATPGPFGGLTARQPTPTMPQKMKIWTPGFSWLFGVLAVASIAGFANYLTLFPYSGLGFLITRGLLGVICLVGVGLTKSNLIRVGLLLQVVSVAMSLFGRSFLGFDLFSLLLPISAALGMICISYGITPWKRTQDVRLTVIQAVVSLGVVPLIFQAFGPDFFTWFFFSCQAFAILVLLLRPACWKAQPIVTLLLALGEIGSLFYWSSYFTGRFFFFFPPFYYLMQFICLALGFLLLIQTERVRQQAQKQQPALVQQP